MDQIVFSFTPADLITFAAILGAIAAIYGYVKRNPISLNTQHLVQVDEKLAKDKQRIDDLEASNKMIAKSLLAIMDHEITGNNIEGLKETKKALQDFIISQN